MYISNTEIPHATYPVPLVVAHAKAIAQYHNQVTDTDKVIIENSLIIDKLDVMKIKILCSVKEPIKMTKRQITDWEKIFCKSHSKEGLYLEYNKNFQNSIFQKRTIQSEHR